MRIVSEPDLAMGPFLDAPATAPSPMAAPGAVHSRRVLCVDDERPVLRALTRLLQREPYDLITTDDPFEAIEWSRLCTIDLLIADQKMPGMSGTDFVRTVRAHSPETIFVLLTGYPDSHAVMAWRDREISRLVTKPWDDEALKALIRDLLREGPAGGESS